MGWIGLIVVCFVLYVVTDILIELIREWNRKRLPFWVVLLKEDDVFLASFPTKDEAEKYTEEHNFPYTNMPWMVMGAPKILFPGLAKVIGKPKRRKL